MRDGHCLTRLGRRTVTILAAGGVHQRVQQVIGRFRHDMAFAALELLACIVAALSARLIGLERLAVDDARGRFDLAPFCEPIPGLCPSASVTAASRVEVHNEGWRRLYVATLACSCLITSWLSSGKTGPKAMRN